MPVSGPFARLERRIVTRPEGDARASARPTNVAMLVVALAAVLPYLATLAYGFVYDDGPIIADNVALHAPSGLITAWHVAYWPPEWGRAGLFRPVVQFAYALLWNVSGGAPSLFHLYAVALYAACAVVVLVMLTRALPAWVAMIGALLFAVHPLHVESVANVAGSAELVAALASLGCLLVLARALERTPASRAIAWRPALASAALFAIAIGAKESAATVPALAALYAWGWREPHVPAPGARAVLVRGWRAWAAFATVLAAMLVARRVVLGGFSPPSSALAVGLEGERFAERWWTMTAAWPRVGHLLLWPTELSMHYGPTTIIPYHTATTVALLAIAGAGGVVLAAVEMARRGDRRPLVAVGWVVLGDLAASNIVVPTGQLLAERTLYFSSLGAVMLVAWLMARAARLPAAAQRAMAAVAVAATIAGGIATVRRARVWSSEERLFQSGIAFDSRAFYPYWQLARAVGRHGDNERGLALLGEAYRRNPHGESLALEYAQHLRTSARGEDALRVLRATANARPRSQSVRLSYLDALLALRGPDSVIDAIDHYAGRDPAGALRLVVLANAYDKLGRPDSVTACYARAVAESPDDAGLRYAYARALARLSLARGDSAGARRALDSALGGSARR